MGIIHYLWCENRENKNLYLCLFGIYKMHKNVIEVFMVGEAWIQEKAGNQADF